MLKRKFFTKVSENLYTPSVRKWTMASHLEATGSEAESFSVYIKKIENKGRRISGSFCTSNLYFQTSRNFVLVVFGVAGFALVQTSGFSCGGDYYGYHCAAMNSQQWRRRRITNVRIATRSTWIGARRHQKNALFLCNFGQIDFIWPSIPKLAPNPH